MNNTHIYSAATIFPISTLNLPNDINSINESNIQSCNNHSSPEKQINQESTTKLESLPRKPTYLEKWKPYDQDKVMMGVSFLRKFQKYWQATFNRRIKVIYGYPLQVGDLIFLLGFWAFFFQQLFMFEEVPDCKHQGVIVSIIMLLTTLFGCRNGIINFVFGVSLERALLWHKFLGWATILLSINLWVHSEYSVTGILLQVPLLGLVVFSIVPIRRQAWEFFIRFHWILILFLFVASILHHIPYGYVGVSMFFIDVIMRIYFAKKYSNISSTFTLERIGHDLVRVIVPKNNTIFYKGGQYFFLMIPKLSYFQWHPFSVCSAPYQDNIVFYVKALGDWTRCLYQIAGEQGKPVKIKGYMDGPYGNQSISIDNDKYQHFVCVSGGVGITPIISTAKELTYEKSKGRPLKSINFIWSTREEVMAYCVLNKLDLFEHLNNDEEEIVKTYYHLTGTKEKSKDIENFNNAQQMVDLIGGRPNFKKYFEEAFNKAKECDDKLVAVLACGPENLIKQVEYLSEEFSKDGIRFDVHQEVFDF